MPAGDPSCVCNHSTFLGCACAALDAHQRSLRGDHPLAMRARTIDVSHGGGEHSCEYTLADQPSTFHSAQSTKRTNQLSSPLRDAHSAASGRA